MPGEPCTAPSLAMRIQIHDEPMPKALIGIVCWPSYYVEATFRTIAPYKCCSRRDKRGRPRKS